MEKQNTQDLNLEDIIREINELELAEEELTELPEEIAQEIAAVQLHEKSVKKIMNLRHYMQYRCRSQK